MMNVLIIVVAVLLIVGALKDKGVGGFLFGVLIGGLLL